MTNNDIRAIIGSSFLDSLRPVSVQSTRDWAFSHIDFSLDATHSGRGKLDLRTYQAPILEAADNPDCKDITVCAVPQTGKSLLWKIILAKRLYDGGISALAVYPNDELAADVNRDTLLPLLRAIPRIRADLDKPRSKSLDSYHLLDCGSVLYFQGAGASIISKSAGLCIADELDQWALPGCGMGATAEESRNVDNLINLRARSMTFADRLLIKCSTPTVPGASIWKEFQKSSKGIYNLACLNCGHLLPSNRLAYPLADGKTFGGLQWKKDDDKGVIPDTIRFICPRCLHAHTFDLAPRMVALGKYVHEHPERVWHMGFLWGALCAPDVAGYTWQAIAEAQEAATPGNLQARKALRNYFLAMPYLAARDTPQDASQDVIRSHCKTAPKDSDIAAVFAAVDVQGGEGANYFVHTVRGYTETGNSYLLHHGICQSLEQLSTLADGTYAGQKIVFGIVDHGGFDHDRSGLTQWVMSRRNWMYYKGDSQNKNTQAKGWEISTSTKKLILANPFHFQTILLDRIYSHTTDTGENYWMLPQDIDEDYLRQLRAVQPSTRKMNGEAYSNWQPQGSDHHDFFDCEKQLFVALAIAESAIIPAAAFRSGLKPLFIRKAIITGLKRQQSAKK